MLQITVNELKQWIKEGKDFFLIDIREPWEHEEYNIGGVLIPLGTIVNMKDTIPTDKDVVLYCEKGIRSVIGIQRLETFGFVRLFNLMGGLKAWKEVE